MPARRRRPSASSTTPASATRSVRCTTAPPPWTGWSRSRSAGSPSPPPPPPASGKTTRSTSSTPPGTSTSPSRWSAACACSTVPLPSSTAKKASSRSPSRSGGRPTSTTSRGSASSTRWTRSAPTSTSPCRTMEERLGANAIPIQLPIGSESDFEGIVDLVEMNAKVWRGETKLGETYDTIEIPAELAGEGRGVPHQAARDRRRDRRGAAGEVLRRRGAHRRRDQGRDPQADHQLGDLPGAVRQRVQEQGRAADARRGHRLPAVAAGRAAAPTATCPARRTR